MARASSAYPDGVAIAIRYAREVVGKKVPACRLAKLTCSRFLRELQQAEEGQGLWEFRTGPGRTGDGVRQPDAEHQRS